MIGKINNWRKLLIWLSIKIYIWREIIDAVNWEKQGKRKVRRGVEGHACMLFFHLPFNLTILKQKKLKVMHA